MPVATNNSCMQHAHEHAHPSSYTHALLLCVLFVHVPSPTTNRPNLELLVAVDKSTINTPPSSISFRLDTPSHVNHLLVPNRFPDTALELCSHARLSASLYLNKLLGIQNLLSSCAQHLAHTIHAMPAMPARTHAMPCHATQQPPKEHSASFSEPAPNYDHCRLDNLPRPRQFTTAHRLSPRGDHAVKAAKS